MANVRLLRQRVQDYQRNYNRATDQYGEAYKGYATDADAFNARVKAGYDAIAAANKKSDLDLVGYSYFDREAGVNRMAGDTMAPVAAQKLGYAAPSTQLAHNTRADRFTEYSADTPGDGDNPGTPGQLLRSGVRVVDANGKVVYEQVDKTPIEDRVGMIGVTRSRDEMNKAIGVGAYWDAYDNVWRNSASGGVAPKQQAVPAPNLTQKEVGILMGKPAAYAEQLKNAGPTAGSAFADPEDPNNLKDAGVLARAIAGKI